MFQLPQCVMFNNMGHFPVIVIRMADILTIVDTQHNLDNQRTYSLSAKTQ